MIDNRTIDAPEHRPHPTPRGSADILASGFGMAIGMWTVGYLLRAPEAAAGIPVAPAPVVFGLMIGCLLLGGFLMGRYSPRGLRAGALAGLLTAAINLLVLGSVLNHDTLGDLAAYSPLILGGAFVVSGAAAGAGALIGRMFRARRPVLNWEFWFAAVLAGGTLVLLMVGGIVTGAEAGLAVPDWPNTEGMMMFAYPLAKMTGGIYLEHAHRLFGALIGLTTLSLLVYLLVTSRDKWTSLLATAAFVAVCVQGVLGGLRVTGRLTLSTDAAELAPNITLAVVHGVFAQIFFALTILLAVTLSTRWRTGPAPTVSSAARTDRFLTTALVFLLIVQLVLGAMQRHQQAVVWLYAHVTLAVVVTFVIFIAGVRAFALHEKLPLVPRFGGAAVLLVGLQLLLGVTALMLTIDPEQGVTATQVIVTTAHQTTGALLLGVTVALAGWTHRFLRPAPTGEPAVGDARLSTGS